MHTAALTVDRAYIASLRPGAPPDGVIDAGPLERWNTANTGGRRQPNQISREFNLPARFSLSFEAVGEPQSWNMAIWLCMKTMKSGNVYQGQTGYQVYLQPENVMVQALSLGAGNSLVSANPAQTSVPGLSRRGAVHVTCLVDRPKNELYLLLDGKLATKLIGARNQKAPDGNAIQFMLNTQPLMQVRDLVLAEWKSTAESLSAAVPAGDVVRMHDRTTVAGPIEAIRDGFVVQAGKALTGLGYVSSIQFDPATAIRARRTNNDVRITLVNGDQLTLTAPRFDERGLTGTAEGLGPVYITASAVRRLHFRPYDPPPKPTAPQYGGYYGNMQIMDLMQ
jgi:hypothetical protein